ncbi:MAG: AAA family ATPase [Lactococcus sp.]
MPEEEKIVEPSDSVNQESDNFNQSMVSWCDGLHLWAQKAVLRYFEVQNPNDLDVSKEFSEYVSAELNGRQLDVGIINPNLFSQHNSTDTLRYCSISNVKGVNAIETSQDQPLLFGQDGLTLVYGMNGTGKSGYMRIFKKIAGQSNSEEILGNIYKSETVVPSCTIALWDGVNKKDVSFKLDESSDPLPFIDVFDGRSSAMFIQEGKDLTFVPRLVGLFSFLSDTADTLKQQANTSIAKIKETMPSLIVPEVSQNTDLGKKISAIHAGTVIFDEEKNWDENDQRKLDELDSLIKNGNKEAELKLTKAQINQLETTLTYLRPVAASQSDNALIDLNMKKKDYLLSMKRRDEAVSLLDSVADPLDKVDLSKDSWKAMWKAVHEYTAAAEKTREDSGLTLVSTCPLCHQEIGDSAVERMSTIDEYVCGRLAKEAVEHRKKLEQAASAFSPSSVEAIRISAADIKGIIGEALYANLLTVLNDLDNSYSSLLDTSDEELHKTGVVEVGKSLKARKEELQSKETLLKSGMESKEYKQAIKDHADLNVKKFCSEKIEDINKAIELHKRLSRQDAAKKFFDTRKFTIKAKEVANQVITEPYIEAFNNELRAFSGTRNIRVALEPRTAGKGRIGHKVILKSAGGSTVAANNVLSDGEMRVVALAAFLAESMQRNPNGVLVFDDPISSLDLEYEGEFSERIAEMAKTSQVIVFTHRLSLMYELNVLCKNRSIAYTESHLHKTPQVAGIPKAGDIRTVGLKTALNKLANQHVTEIKKMDTSSIVYENAITGLVGDLRVLIERCIEETLVYGVVTRFNRNISTQKIKCLASITESDCTFLDGMMSKYSVPIHSQSVETPKPQYSIEEIEADIVGLKDWNKVVSERNEKTPRAS